MYPKVEVAVLEYLLDQDALSETVVRELYEHLLVQGGDQSKTIQVRLLLRVLREHAANISDATLNALNCLAVNSTEGGGDYSPYATLRQLVPSIELYLQVRPPTRPRRRRCRAPAVSLCPRSVLERPRLCGGDRSKRSWSFSASGPAPWRPSCRLKPPGSSWRSTFRRPNTCRPLMSRGARLSCHHRPNLACHCLLRMLASWSAPAGGLQLVLAQEGGAGHWLHDPSRRTGPAGQVSQR